MALLGQDYRLCARRTEFFSTSDGHCSFSLSMMPAFSTTLMMVGVLSYPGVRRYFDATGPLRPWLVTDVVAPERLGDRLRDRCGAAPEPVQLSNLDSLWGVPFRRWVTLEITISDELAGQPLFMERGRRMSQDDFPELVAEIRRQSRKEFGPRADRPD